MKRKQLNGTPVTRAFAPYCSRKNMKRAKGIKQRGVSTPSTMGLGGMGALLAPLLLTKSQASSRNR